MYLAHHELESFLLFNIIFINNNINNNYRYSQGVKQVFSLWFAAGVERRQLKLSTQAESRRHSPRSILQTVSASRGACGSPLPS